MSLIIREMDESFLGNALEIYRWYVQNTTHTFQIADPEENQMKELLFFCDPDYRSFSVIDGTVLIGYGIVTRFKEREAFRKTAEVTIYLSRENTGKGYGRKILSYLEDYAASRGFHALVALISGENDASCALFERLGYKKCAHYHEVGRKFERWLDLVCYEKLLPAA